MTIHIDVCLQRWTDIPIKMYDMDMKGICN